MVWHNGAMNEKQTETVEILRPTKKQKELLGYIEQFIAEHGYSPSYREIMNGLEYTSVATVALHVKNLMARGHLRKRDHSARSLEVVQPSEGAVAPVLKTNEVKLADERWLVEKIEHQFSELEAAVKVTREQLDDIYVLLAALRVLGLDGAAQSFTSRTTTLKDRLSEA